MLLLWQHKDGGDSSLSPLEKRRESLVPKYPPELKGNPHQRSSLIFLCSWELPISQTARKMIKGLLLTIRKNFIWSINQFEKLKLIHEPQTWPAHCHYYSTIGNPAWEYPLGKSLVSRSLVHRVATRWLCSQWNMYKRARSCEFTHSQSWIHRENIKLMLTDANPLLMSPPQMDETAV